MILTTERLLLRPWNDDDADDLYLYAKDPEVGPIAGWPPHTCREESLAVIRSVLNAPEAYAVCLREDERAIGAVELKLFRGDRSGLPQGEDECEMGFWLAKPFWGRGIIPEAARELLRRAFEDLSMERVWCGYYDGNVKSKRAQEKIGFRYVRTSVDRPVLLMKERRTEHINCMTRREWETIRGMAPEKER